MDDVNEWRSYAASAAPADRARAEAGVRLAYRLAGLPEPARILWARSPLEGVRTVAGLTDAGASVREAVRTRPWAAERRRLHEELGPEGWPARWSATGGRLWELTQSLVDRIREGVLEEIGRKESARARLILLDAMLGQHDAPWLAAFAADRERVDGDSGSADADGRSVLSGGLESPASGGGTGRSAPGDGSEPSASGAGVGRGVRGGAPEFPASGSGAGRGLSPGLPKSAESADPTDGAGRGLPHSGPGYPAPADGAGHGLSDGGPGSQAALPAHPLAGLAEVCRSAGWWWAFEEVAVVCERPVELHRDEAGRLDRGDGPALAFADGFALCAWRGMPVPPGFLDELRTLVPQRIQAEENAELRRVMLEFYGYERYLTDSGAKPVHRDETGVLWRIEMGIDEPVVMVEVTNSTPEPDGSRNVYWLRVPPRTRTAREGVAWTFGLDASAYAPLQET
ncbi:DUF6745 domain-containing protein [Streptomyces roseirectus]|uniref:DUF6745 domain-containing protein n=1 Tax=Streptomyces roseirectus TaxID=2768066 RepID=UPI001FE33A72|nr:hypothetical protein [Streptomyces roseirectus]